MPFKPGTPKPKNSGRKPGTANRSTEHAREALAVFVDANTARLQAWLDSIETTDGPQAAWRCLMDVLEYHVPKLQRTELVGKDGGPVQTTVIHEYVTPPKP